MYVRVRFSTGSQTEMKVNMLNARSLLTSVWLTNSPGVEATISELALS